MMNCRYPQPDSSHRLFCFPWAGGGSNFYAGWGKDTPLNIEVFGITLRGRESRFAETPCSSAQETVSEIASILHKDFGQKPIIFFGHSMGALLCYETATVMKTTYGKEPQHMYLSGVSTPHTESRQKESKDLSKFSDEEFRQYLRELDDTASAEEPFLSTVHQSQHPFSVDKKLCLLPQLHFSGGTPPEILENQELFKLILPALKADFTIVNQMIYECPDKPPSLSCPITFFDGAEDNDHDYEGWRQLTSGSFTLYKLPGGHFYLKHESNYKRIIETIRNDFPYSFGC